MSQKQKSLGYKECIILSILVLSFIFSPNHTYAKALLVSNTQKLNVLIGNNLPITVSTDDKKAGILISFRAIEPEITFTPYDCTTTSSGSCTTTFTSTKNGTFNINITAPGYITRSTLPIVVTKGQLTLSTNPARPKAGDQVTVIASTSDNQTNVTVTFIGLSEFTGGAKTCVTGVTGSCSITYTSAPNPSASTLIANAPGYGTSSIFTETLTNQGQTCPNQQVVVNGKCADPLPSNYKLLVPLPGAGTNGGDLTTFDASQPDAFAKYLNLMIKLFIGICAVLAMVMIVAGGIQYMTTELISSKEDGKKRITDAILGLLLALGAYTLLYTVNPDLLRVDVINHKGQQATLVNIGGDTNAPIGNVSQLPTGIVCNGGQSNIPNIAQSFNNKITYSQDVPKGKPGPNSTIKLDCSGFVNYVLKCANANFINSGTDQIFAGAERVTSITDTMVNNTPLKEGDLVGWRPSDDAGNNGHVMIYIGNGKVADSHSGSSVGGALGVFPTTKYKDRIRYIKRIDFQKKGGGGDNW